MKQKSAMPTGILDEKNGAVVGTIDVESELANAFSDEHRKTLEDCAKAARPPWVQVGAVAALRRDTDC